MLIGLFSYVLLLKHGLYHILIEFLHKKLTFINIHQFVVFAVEPEDWYRPIIYLVQISALKKSYDR